MESQQDWTTSQDSWCRKGDRNQRLIKHLQQHLADRGMAHTGDPSSSIFLRKATYCCSGTIYLLASSATRAGHAKDFA
ncbi:hypothetical protein DPMN_149084 [Dreissena polymorpha]|uniref:Uncharacterized protein n=1 Tax=Dreissena polymorpha TaxID=45954 RepID=A0A9D4J4E4_DREPO|nr:hypothetical protein DPMN_149084 [Dreissena polymorpha]